MPRVQSTHTARAAAWGSVGCTRRGTAPGREGARGKPGEYNRRDIRLSRPPDWPPMPLKDQQVDQTPAAAISPFLEACATLWPHATKLVLHRKAKPKKVAYEGDVVLLKDKDGAVVDDSKSCVDELMRVAAADAERTGPGEYRISLIGIQELPIRGRKKTTDQEPTELKTTAWIRVGDFDDDDDPGDAGSVRGILREAGKLVSSTAGAVQQIAQGSNTANDGLGGVIEIQKKVIDAQAAAFVAVSTMEQKHNDTTVAIKTLEINHEQWRFDQEQKERRYQEERADREKAAAEEAAQRREFMQQGLGALTALVQTVVEDRKAERASREEEAARARGETPPPRTEAPPPPPPNTIATTLAAAIAHLTSEQHEQLVEIFGRTTPRKIGASTPSVWELIVGASKQTSDEDAINTLRNIGTDLAARVTASARTAVEQELLDGPQAQTILDAYRRIA